jgi:hypothetical protein
LGWGLAQVVEHPPSKHEVLGSNSSTAENKETTPYKHFLSAKVLLFK